MTLYASAKLTNLTRSYEQYMTVQLGSQISVGLEGAAIDEQLGTAEWIEPSLVGPARPITGLGRYLRPGVRAQRCVYILHVNILCRPSSSQGDLYRLKKLRDLVVGVLHEYVKIPVYDYDGVYTGGAYPQIGVLELGAVSMDQAVPTPENVVDLQQWSYSINSNWIEEYSG